MTNKKSALLLRGLLSISVTNMRLNVLNFIWANITSEPVIHLVMLHAALVVFFYVNPPWWHRRTRMERCLTLLTTTFLFVIVGLIIALAATLVGNRYGNIKDVQRFKSKTLSLTPEAQASISTSSGTNTNNSLNLDDFCMTPGCIKAAYGILESLDTTISPCDDFFSFTCGNFVKNRIIPDDRTSLSSFSLLSDELREQLRILIENPLQDNTPLPFRLVQELYQSCMNKTQIAKLGLQPMHDILQQFGGWPVVSGDKWNEDKFMWYNSVYKSREIGYSVDYFLDFSVTTDLKNSLRRIIDLDQPSLGMSREYLIKGFEDEDVQAYHKYQLDMAVLLGADKKRAKKELKEALDFEITLANFSLPREERRNATKLYNPMTIANLTEMVDSIPWLKYIRRLVPPEITVTEDEVVIVNVPEYFKKFAKFIEATPKRVQANYALWRIVKSSVSLLTEEARKIQLEYSSKLTGQTERRPRWEECIGDVTSSLSHAVGSLYVRKYFKEDSKKSASDMVKDIGNEFLVILDELDWMDKKTRDRAKVKARSITEHIGYPPELLEDKKLEELYEGLEMNSTHYLLNALNLTIYGTNYIYGKLREKVNKTDWVRHGSPAIVNAFYSPLENSIQFPAGILQGVFFSNDRPKYMNYAAIGWVIGHEITHGFDDEGRQFDKDGNLKDWWEPETKEKYLKKAKCIIEQYGNYTVPEVGPNVTLNGINTQGENIADNGGIKEAYRAYEKWTWRNHKEKRLPGLDYNQKQLFWISAANVWCCKYRPASLKQRVLTGVHSPGMFRVQGPLSNMKEFAKDFNCPLGREMNPVNKCSVW